MARFTALPAGASPSHLGLKPHTSLSNIHTTSSNPLKEASFRPTFNRIQPTSKKCMGFPRYFGKVLGFMTCPVGK
jgi:hypothetical protein